LPEGERGVARGDWETDCYEAPSGDGAPERWDAYPIFVLVILAAVLLTMLVPWAQLGSLLAAGALHAH
jgi:hypothetical protein